MVELNGTDLLENPGFRTESVDVPGWPVRVVVHELGALDLVRWKRGCAGYDTDLLGGAALVVLCARTVDGKPLWTQEQVELVAGLPYDKLNLLAAAALRVNGLSDAEVEKAQRDFGTALS